MRRKREVHLQSYTQEVPLDCLIQVYNYIELMLNSENSISSMRIALSLTSKIFINFMLLR